MKTFYFSLIAIVLLSFQTLYAQTVDSSITVKKKNGTYFVSGIVSDEQIKNQVIEIIKSQTAENINANGLKVDNNAVYLSSDWQTKFTKQISKIKNLKTALVQFKTDPNDYPAVPEKLLNAEILLTENGEKIKLADYKANIIILSFVAEWAKPAQKTVSDLNKLYAENLKDLRIIAVSVEDVENDKLNFERFVKINKVKFQTGWADRNFIENFFEISKFNGVPQSFVIKKEKLRGVFLGAAPKVNEALVNLVKKISNE